MRINYKGTDYDVDDKYSFKDFTGWDLTNRKDMNDIVIYGSCFSNETPDAKVFPEDMSGVTFIVCNLDNCTIPDNHNTVLEGSQRRFKVQNDLRDWEINALNQPVKVLNEEYWIQQGISVRPETIPLVKFTNQEQIWTDLKAIDVDPVGGEL